MNTFLQYINSLVIETIKTRGRAKVYSLVRSAIMLGVGYLVSSGVITSPDAQAVLGHAGTYAADAATVLVGLAVAGWGYISAHYLHIGDANE